MRWPHPVLAVSALVALALGLVFALSGRDFCLDDAYIHLDYALSLKLGDGFSYNPGDWETGTSSPLFVLLLAAWPWGSDPVLSVKLLGVLLHAASAMVAAAVAMRCVRASALQASAPPATVATAGLTAGILTAASPSLLQGATSGMEVSLTVLLLLLAVFFELGGRYAGAALCIGLATLSRPEALFFGGSYGALRALFGRRPKALLLALGGGLGLGGWVAYCLSVSGVPWPNTKYVKTAGIDPQGLSYLAIEVLLGQPWLIGCSGLVLIGFALVRARGPQRSAQLALVGAWGATLIATAVTRPCPLGLLFYVARYFAIVAAVPAIPVAVGLVQQRRTIQRVLWLVPIAIVNVLQVVDTRAAQLAQERSITRSHHEPARFVAASLPRDAVIIAEGAGASRFYTPRSMRIIDMIGLNHRPIAHAKSDQERLCTLLAARPTHLLIPDPYLGLTRPLDVKLIHRFVDPDYRVSRTSVVRSVHLFSTTGLKPRWRSFCEPGKADLVRGAGAS